MLDWLATPRLRPVLSVLGLMGLLALTACGGGSGAPNNPFVTPPVTPALVVAPTALTAYSGVPVTITVTSGVAPFFAFTSDASILPVAQNVAGSTIVLLPNKVSADTQITITVQDSAGQSTSAKVTVSASTIFNALTFAPSGPDCGANLCSGQTGTATVIATGPGNVPLVGRQIRFDVVLGAFGITTTNPATPLVQTLTVATDNSGTAVAPIRADSLATTQPAQIRATDVTSGQQQIANFTIVNNTVAGGSPLAVVPDTVKITGPTTTTCSSGFRTDYYIYGGNPPYTVASTFPTSIVIVNRTVFFSGGFFEAITNGSCVNPLVFTIVDSAGKQTTAELINDVGTTAPPPATPVAIAPSDQKVIGCNGKTVIFVVSGGTAPYNANVSPSTPAGPNASISGSNVSVINIPAGPGIYNVNVIDSSVPATSTSATITCS